MSRKDSRPWRIQLMERGKQGVTKLTLWADIDDQEHTFISTASAPSPRSDKKLVSSFQQTSPTTSWESEGFDY